ncbi:MAG: serine protease [Algibacter sp.]|uniref:S1 family peptidase n=1 Tax=Algibacter sp. TaxID=1872428 RepID=UPI003298D2FF
MKINYIIYLSLILGFQACNSSKNIPENEDTLSKTILDETENSSAFIRDATNAINQLILEDKHTPFEKIKHDKIENHEVNSGVDIMYALADKKTGNEMYHHLQKSTLYIGISYLCGKCPNVHLSAATGFVIHEDGIVVTNYHVITPQEGLQHFGVFAVSHEGVVYNVTEVLSSSKANDLAILKIDTQGAKLDALPLAKTELVGEGVYMMGHPFQNTFLMTKGIISRKYEGSKKIPRITITAEFGNGASGGPVVNEYGQVIGIVSSTRSHYTNGSNPKNKGDLQLTLNIVVPVSQLNKYVKLIK